MARNGHGKVLRSRSKPGAAGVWELLGPSHQKHAARVLSLSELAEAAKANRRRPTRWNSDKDSDKSPDSRSQLSASGLLAPHPVADEVETSDMAALIRRIESSLGPDPSEEEITEAAKVAFWAFTDEERRSIGVDELRRRLAVHRSTDPE